MTQTPIEQAKAADQAALASALKASKSLGSAITDLTELLRNDAVRSQLSREARDLINDRCAELLDVARAFNRAQFHHLNTFHQRMEAAVKSFAEEKAMASSTYFQEHKHEVLLIFRTGFMACEQHPLLSLTDVPGESTA